MNFKFSNYNHKIELDDDIYIFNALSGGFCKLNSELKNLFQDIDIRNDHFILENLNSDFINGLKKGFMIIDKNIDEKKLIKATHSLDRFGSGNSLGLTLVPTTACNFRCVYCFEKDNGYPTTTMSRNVMDEIIKLVDEKLNKNGQLAISWYGGEPLIAFKEIKYVQSNLNLLSKSKKFNINSSIVTNGYLLTKEISNELVNLGISFAQITLDGYKDIHNKRRFLQNGKGSYDKIIQNILTANSNLMISIRVNIDKDNIEFMNDFFDDLEKKGVKQLKNVSIYFAVVRSFNDAKCTSNNCYSVESFSEEEIRLNAIAYQRGFNIGLNVRPLISNCASLSPKSMLIEPDGSIQKCWSDVGIKERRIGHILNLDYDKELAQINKCNWYSWHRYEDEMCDKCSILPICMGGCPYYSLTEDNPDYRCIGLKYNLDKTLKLIAKKHYNK